MLSLNALIVMSTHARSAGPFKPAIRTMGLNYQHAYHNAAQLGQSSLYETIMKVVCSRNSKGLILRESAMLLHPCPRYSAAAGAKLDNAGRRSAGFGPRLHAGPKPADRRHRPKRRDVASGALYGGRMR